MTATAELTREEAARRYLEASRAASIHKPGSEGRAAHEETMRLLERRHPKVREHAIVGTGEDFDQPLDRNLREHQAQLRRDSRMTNPQIATRRKALREVDYGRHKPSQVYRAANPQPPQPKPTRPERPPSRPGPRSRPRARTARTRGYARQTGIPGAAKSTTQTVMEALGIAIGLSLAYLALQGKGPGALKSGLEGISKLINLLIAPVDPLNPAGAKSAAEQSEISNELRVFGQRSPTPAEAKKGQTFGPAPGAGSGLVQGVSP